MATATIGACTGSICSDSSTGTGAAGLPNRLGSNTMGCPSFVARVQLGTSWSPPITSVGRTYQEVQEKQDVLNG